MSNSDKNYEDIVLKTAHTYFGKELLPLWDIHEELEDDNGITEIPVLVLTNMYMDFTFLTKSGKYLHFEFQTTDGGIGDLRRFHSYEAWLHYISGKDVITYVIFTGGIRKICYEESYGINTYRTMPICMDVANADSILAQLHEKKARGEALTDKDLAQLALTPLFEGASSPKERIIDAARLMKGQHNSKATHAMAMLYAFAEKFLDNEQDLKDIKEVIFMTRLGQMIFDEGEQKGLERGEKIGLERGLEQGEKIGLERGLKQGAKLATERINRLYALLLFDSRIDDIRRAAVDSEYLEKLFKEYQL